MKIKGYLVKAFTKNKNQGNPAGVILNADDLSDKQMLSISNDLGFSESAFVQSSDEGDYRVRFFSPKQEVDLCGHATIATFHVIKEKLHPASQNITLTQETRAGILPVKCYKDGRIMMTQAEPQFYNYIPDVNEVVSLLSISVSGLLDYPIQIVSTGTPKLLIPTKSLDILLSIKPNFRSMIEYSKKHDARGFYPFSINPEVKETDSDFHARQFNPLIGVNEDPLTGVAAGALGAYVKKHKILQKNEFVIEQGYVMNKSGIMYVDVNKEVQVGGYGVIYGQKNIVIK